MTTSDSVPAGGFSAATWNPCPAAVTAIQSSSGKATGAIHTALDNVHTEGEHRQTQWGEQSYDESCHASQSSRVREIVTEGAYLPVFADNVDVSRCQIYMADRGPSTSPWALT